MSSIKRTTTWKWKRLRHGIIEILSISNHIENSVWNAAQKRQKKNYMAAWKERNKLLQANTSTYNVIAIILNNFKWQNTQYIHCNVVCFEYILFAAKLWWPKRLGVKSNVLNREYACSPNRVRKVCIIVATQWQNGVSKYIAVTSTHFDWAF